MKEQQQQPTVEQLKALIWYADQFGRNWKRKLNDDWMYARTSGLLLGIRNQFGPSWLSRFDLKKAKAQVALSDGTEAMSLSAAEQAGRAAFVAGKTCTPALDLKALAPLIGDSKPGDGWAVKVMNAWRKGWEIARKQIFPDQIGQPGPATEPAGEPETEYTVSVEQSMTFLVPVSARTREEAMAKAVKLVEADDMKFEVDDSSVAAVNVTAEKY